MNKLFVYLICGIFTLTVVDANNKSTLTLCSPYPVCATNGTHSFLFENEYRFNTENAKRERNYDAILLKIEIANCFKKCDQLCTNEYAPICTTSDYGQKTFQNRCQLDLENCENGNIWMILYEGECLLQPARRSIPVPPKTAEECPTFCTLEINPICAIFEGVEETFQNVCYLKVDMCTSKRNWQIKHNGECIVPEPKCDEACPKIYSPMCATLNGENRTFDNECLLDLEICKTGNKWDLLYRGECIQPAPNCPTICTEIYQPVCGKYNDDQRTFPNNCFLNVEACKTGQLWIIEYEGECKVLSTPCPDVCPFIYQPVCASLNGVTRGFSNRCLLGVETCKTKENWEVIYEGECIPATTIAPPIVPIPQQPVSSCPDACPAVYNPVCASYEGSRRTFSNGCELSVEACRTGQNWEVLFNVACEDELIVQDEAPAVAICPAIFDPMCAALNGAKRTFSNKCEMDAEISRTKEDWKLVYPGECEVQSPAILPTGPCPRCSDFYEPVCGFYNGEQKTFINECQMLGENCYSDKKWVLVYKGECKVSDQPKNCPNICPISYEPVCATFNGVKRTFPNRCELNHEAYKTNSQWVILNTGECDYCPSCSDDLDPVCAEYNGKVKSFDNSCKMESENCKTGSVWKIVSKTFCEADKCPTICPRIYSPICGSSNGESRTFANTCEMKMEACKTKIEWTEISKGECPALYVSCPESCNLQYSPVCALFQGTLRTFDNECLLRAEICKSKIDWIFIHPGSCSQQPGSRSTVKCQILQCSTIYEPVCGAYKGDLKSFSNTCFLENTNCRYDEDWKIINQGPCQPRTLGI